MADVSCLDGSVLSVLPVPVLDREGVPYEVTLRLLRDGEPFGTVGERCGWFLARAVARVRAAGGEVPASELEDSVRAWAGDADLDPDRTWSSLQPYLPRDRELCAFRSREPDDLPAVAELRVGLRCERAWQAGTGWWSLRTVAVVDTWGDGGAGVRARLGVDALLRFLEQLLRDCAAVGASYEVTGEPDAARNVVAVGALD